MQHERAVCVASLSLSSGRGTWDRISEANFDRAVQGLTSALLALKIKPYIRYQATSEVCGLLSRKITETVAAERELFQFGRTEGSSLLLILDRREDPVTPLLSQWTYQAMVHELLKIEKNTVSLESAPGVHPDMK